VQNQTYNDTVQFITRFFGVHDHAVELRACPNIKGQPGAESLITRDPVALRDFCRRKDVDGIGVYFGAATRRQGATSGNASNVMTCPALWVDIDCVKQGLSGQQVIDVLEFLPHQPTIIINSGGGLHAYWILEEAVDVDEDRERLTQALRALAHILAGDMACAEVARIMRLPGTMNSKDATKAIYDGQSALCGIVSDNGSVHDFDSLCEWLNDQRAVLHGKAEPARSVRENDPFVAYARSAGYEPSIDIDAELAAMSDGNIHQTQLRVSMSMIARGYEDDEIVSTILAATERAAPRDQKWNWSSEEKAIRKMIASGKQKALEREDRAPTRSMPMSSGNAALKLVHNADADEDEQPQKRKKERKESASQTVVVGKATISVWHDRYGPVMHTDGLTYAYEAGIWVQWDDKHAQRLRAIIQEACASLGIEPKTSLLNAAKAYFMDRPELIRQEVEFDQHGLIIAEDGTVDPLTGAIGEHSPEHYARYKVGAKAAGDRSVASWVDFLRGTFADKSDEEAGAIISTLQEWFGAALVANKSRAMRLALLAHGPSRTGKTQIAEVVRGLLGYRHVSGAPMRDLEGRFGLEPFLGKRGWVTDDAVGEGEFMDADTYKKIVTGEKMSVQCKGGRNVETHFGFPVCITMNNMPRVKEQSDAVYNRSLVLPCTKVRSENAPEPAGYNSIAEKIVSEELTGLFWWAFEGWQRLAARGHYDPPKTMTDARKGFEADNNPVGTWMAECTEPDPACKIMRADLLASMNGWWTQEYGVDAKLWSGRGFFPRMTKAIPGYSKEHNETTDNEGQRYLIGVRLNKTGILAWKVFKGSRWSESTKTSSEDHLVNKDHQSAAPASGRPGNGRTVF
jgi:P4 family phage/plasmid primase-like protien